MTAPKWTNSGAVLRLKGKGVQGKNGRGDQYVTLTVRLPDKPDPDLEKFFAQKRCEPPPQNPATRHDHADSDFFDHDPIEAETIAIWVEAGWLAPDRNGDNGLSEIDIARARLIHDLKNNIGVNDEAVPLILDLIDQLHGLRRAMRQLVRRRGL